MPSKCFGFEMIVVEQTNNQLYLNPGIERGS